MSTHKKPLRDRTLGEIADVAGRHGRYVAIVAGLLIVIGFLPGELPVRTQLPGDSGGWVASHPDAPGRAALPPVAATPRAEPAGAGASVADTGTTAGLFEPPAPRGSAGVGPTFGPTTGPPSDDLRCGPDEALPEPVLAPTLKEAQAAQAAVEGALGQPAPVNLVSLVAAALDCGAVVRSGMAELFVLSDLIPAGEKALMSAFSPAFRATCSRASMLAAAVTSSAGRPHPVLSRAVAFCTSMATSSAESGLLELAD